MNNFCSIALIATLAAAQSDNAEAIRQLTNYAAKFGKTYSDIAEMNKRAAVLQANKAKYVKLMMDHPRATFGETKFSDWTQEEFEAILGRKDLTDGDRRELSTTGPTNGPAPERRALQDYPDIDWVAAGNMHVVKDQGSCGSCAAFAAATVLEGMLSIQEGTNVHLSEQQGLDCSGSYGNGGCRGGLMELYFEFYADNGAMLNSDYPYAGIDQSCEQTSSSTIATTADWSTFVWLPKFEPVSVIYAELTKGPLSIGINASDWSGYTGGVLSEGERNCGGYLNHGVTATGFTSASTTTTTQDVTVTSDPSCYRASRTEKKSKQCDGAATLHKGSCCTPGTTTTTTEEVTTFVGAFWTVQNQWGTGWGDNGFIYFEADEGRGVCGFNEEVQHIYVK